MTRSLISSYILCNVTVFSELFNLRNRKGDFQVDSKWKINELKEERFFGAGLTFLEVCINKWLIPFDTVKWCFNVSLKKILPLDFVWFNVIMRINYVFSDLSCVFINMKIILRQPFRVSLKLKLEHCMVNYIAHILGSSSNKSRNKIPCGCMLAKNCLDQAPNLRTSMELSRSRRVI